MTHRPHVLLTAAALTLGSSLVLATSSTSHAAPSTCQGKAVTIVATTTVTKGTEGDDVVAMEPGAWFTFDALGGNDTICLAVGAGGSGRDPMPPSGFLDAGAGDDTVVNLAPAGSAGIITTVVLGLGRDTFQGADIGETVFAEKQVGDFDDPYAVDPTFVGAQTDVVSGAATVFSSAPNDAPNPDRITFGSGTARVVLDGPMAPSQGSIDVSAATTAALEVRRPSGLRPAVPAGVTVTNRRRYVEVRGVPLIWWTGEVQTFTVGHPLLRADEPPVTFIGGPSAEHVTLVDVPMGPVTLGTGDDSLTVRALNHGYVPQWAYGGPGRDSVSITAVCRELVVRIDHASRCDDTKTSFGSFHDVVATTGVRGSSVTVVGTDDSQRLVASGTSVVVRGLGGSDEIGVDDSISARVRAGAGADRVWASGDDVVVRGGGGHDRIRLLGTAGISPTGQPVKQQVALGGRDHDVLVGTGGTGPDRLVGGSGRDRADGRAGRRDFCSAEVTRRCERP